MYQFVDEDQTDLLTVKIGRDIGIFASDAILNDLTLFGSGTPAGNFAPGNTTLGRIGIGYIYTDFIPQITYKSPNFNGFTVTAGAFSTTTRVNNNDWTGFIDLFPKPIHHSE